MTLPPPQPVLFMDTCVLHVAHLYLGVAEQRSLYPMPGGMTATESRRAVESTHRLHNRASLKKGLKVIEYVVNQRAEVGFPPSAHLEWVCGLLRGYAMLKSARERMPQRMWNRLGAREIQERIDDRACRQTVSMMGELTSRFASAGISFQQANPDRVKAVMQFAPQLLQAGVFLEFGDCIVYASAVLALADEFLTSDRHLHEIAKWISDPSTAPPDQQARFRRIHARIRKLVPIYVVGADRDPDWHIPRISYNEPW